MYSKNLADYALVNNFIENEEFNLFSFGSIGTYKKYKPDVFKDIYIVTNYSSAQSNIFSKKSRQKLYKAIGHNKFQGDIDTDYIDKLDKLYSYKYPLIVQLMPLTENMKNWGNGHGIVVKLGCSLTKVFIKIVRLDEDTSGWEYIYVCNRYRWYLNYILIILGLYILYKIANLVYPKLKIKKTKFKK